MPRAVSPQKQQQVAQQAPRAAEVGGLSSRMATVEERLRSGDAGTTSPRSTREQDTDSYSEHSGDSDHDSLDSLERTSGGDALHLSPRRRHSSSSSRRRRYDGVSPYSPVLGRDFGGGGGMLTVQVLRCKDLVGADRNGLSDPYVKLRISSTPYKWGW